MTPYDRTHLSRNRTAGAFPFPELRACIDYAITEFAGEFRDALLRSERVGDKRNHERNLDERNELGQAFYMLLSSCIRADHAPQLVPIVGAYSTRRQCNEVVRYLTHAADYAEMLEDEPGNDRARIALQHSLDSAYSYMVALCTLDFEWPVDGVVDAACTKFERKWAPWALEPATVQEGVQ